MGVVGVVAIVHRAVVVATYGSKGPVGDDRRAGLQRDSLGVAEVIGMRMGDEDRMDELHVEAGVLHAREERLPRRLAGQAGVDQRHPTVIVNDGVTIHMR